MAEIITYRRPKQFDRWHFRQECELWPDEKYEEVTADHPPAGAFCRECLYLRINEIRASSEHWLTKKPNDL